MIRSSLLVKMYVNMGRVSIHFDRVLAIHPRLCSLMLNLGPSTNLIHKTVSVEPTRRVLKLTSYRPINFHTQKFSKFFALLSV